MTDLPTVLVLPIMYFAVKPGPQSISKQPAFLSPPGFKATNMHREILIALVQMQRSNYNFAERKCWESRFQHTAQSNIRNGNAIVPAYRAGHQVLPAMTFAQHVLSKTIRSIRLTEEKQSLKNRRGCRVITCCS